MGELSVGIVRCKRWLAKGPAGMEYIPVMVAEHEIPQMVSTYQMGIRDYDVEKAFEAMEKNADYSSYTCCRWFCR